jgi:hypothetical protein
VRWRFLGFLGFLWGFCASVHGEEYGWVGTNSLSLPHPAEHELRIISPSILELTWIGTKKDENSPPHPWNFVGPNFETNVPTPQEFEVRINGEAGQIQRVGFKRRPLYAPLKVRDLRILNEIYLELAQPLLSNARVQVLNPDKKLWPETVKFEAAAEAMRFSPAIHANEVGYEPGFPKRAMAGYYLGTLGELKIPAQTFSIVDAGTGKAAFEGKLRPRHDKGFPDNPPPYQSVLEADFTKFDQPGTYRLQVPGLGASFPFQINDGTFAVFARTYALGLYHQRCGTNNAFPSTRFVHDPCHTAPAEVPNASFKTAQAIIAEVASDAKNDPRHRAPPLTSTDASLYPFVRKGKIDVSGGHHDAGDYSKYTINSAGLIHALVFAADNFTGVAELDNLGLPESGDGRSDILEEAKWEADFLAKMQDDDGGFYFLVYPKERQYEDNVLPDKGDPQIVWPKNTAATAAATAALAEIGSSPTFKKQFPEAAELYMSKALGGWQFLQRAIAKYGGDGAYQKLTHYGNEFLHDDELAWAAAALFVATGKKEFQAKLIAGFNPESRETRRWSWWPLFEGYGNAARTYVFSLRNGRLKIGDMNAVFLTRCESLIHETAMNHVRFARETAYGTSFPDPNKANRNAGWYFSMERAFDIAVAWQLRHEPAYLDAIVSNLNYEAGCNPVNVCYLTGMGWRRQREIVHQYAQNDYRVLPPSGLPLGNIQGGFAYLYHYKRELGALTFPPDGAANNPYPFYDRWGDSFNTTTEFVVVDQARSLATAAFLMAQTNLRTQSWRAAPAKITGLPASATSGETLHARLEVDGLDTRDAQIVWEARDQEPVIAREYAFMPRNVGEQWVEAEAMWPDGRRAFAKTVLGAGASLKTPANRSRSLSLKPDAETIALYHLDNALADASGHSPALKLGGNAAFDTGNLSWMTQRQGAALRFKDINDKAFAILDLTKIGSPVEVTVEAMIYLNAFKAYNRTNAKILSLQEDWNSALELFENIYEGPMVRGGTEFSIKKDELVPLLTPSEWHHVTLSLKREGYFFGIDGKVIKTLPSKELGNWCRKPASLEIGNFDGYIDEVVVRCRSAKSANKR